MARPMINQVVLAANAAAMTVPTEKGGDYMLNNILVAFSASYTGNIVVNLIRNGLTFAIPADPNLVAIVALSAADSYAFILTGFLPVIKSDIINITCDGAAAGTAAFVLSSR